MLVRCSPLISMGNLPPDTRFAYHVEHGYGIDGERDGLIPFLN